MLQVKRHQTYASGEDIEAVISTNALTLLLLPVSSPALDLEQLSLVSFGMSVTFMGFVVASTIGFGVIKTVSAMHHDGAGTLNRGKYDVESKAKHGTHGSGKGSHSDTKTKTVQPFANLSRKGHKNRRQGQSKSIYSFSNRKQNTLVSTSDVSVFDAP